MNIGLLFAYAARYSEGEGGGGLLSVNPGLAFWTVLTFLLLLLILKKVAWKPILNALDEREAKIRESLEMAEKAKDEAALMIAEHKQSIQQAEEEAKAIVEQARRYAEQVKEKMLEDSKQQAQKIVGDASLEIERKKNEAFTELKRSVAELSIAIAEKLLRKNLDHQQQSKVVDEYIKEIQKN
jgi:F-type H+-transporting ATPase subunit b